MTSLRRVYIFEAACLCAKITMSDLLRAPLQSRCRSYVDFFRVKIQSVKERATPMCSIMQTINKGEQSNGPATGHMYMQKCREALEALDRCGWKRSFHQMQFHDSYIRACARVFWKTLGDGQFSRDHQAILEINNWDCLEQEVLVSTPRRFGKTISVSMFAAAFLFSCPEVELSIYSTCKRISQKLLRNVVKFLSMIYTELGISPYPIIRQNQEELQVCGPNGALDLRLVNSYPSRVKHPPPTHPILLFYALFVLRCLFCVVCFALFVLRCLFCVVCFALFILRVKLCTVWVVVLFPWWVRYKANVCYCASSLSLAS
jgi:hypothetical protein